MPEQISREELAAFTLANSRVAVALDKITDRLLDLAVKQDKMIDKVTNGVSEVIVKGVADHYDASHKETVSALSRMEANQALIRKSLDETIPATVDAKLSGSSIARDIMHVKWLVGIVGLAIIICVAILRVTQPLPGNSAIEKQNQIIQHMLEQHFQADKTTGGVHDGT